MLSPNEEWRSTGWLIEFWRQKMFTNVRLNQQQDLLRPFSPINFNFGNFNLFFIFFLELYSQEF